ncbi:MAG: gliding motility protein GldB [Prevotella sp.]
MVSCVGCEFQLKPNDAVDEDGKVSLHRYDRIQSLYLTTGDFSALQQMNLVYPQETRTLIEDVLKLGKVNDPDINNKFLNFYQDTVLQSLINEVEQQYANVDDLNKELQKSFDKLKEKLPTSSVPMVYTQIGALDQSIVVGNNSIGISLDKYLGSNYPLYMKYYPESQRRLMTRGMIVPDCLVFYILSLYPMPDYGNSQLTADIHIGKIQWIVNKLMGRRVFKNKYTVMVAQYMKKHSSMSFNQLLSIERLP